MSHSGDEKSTGDVNIKPTSRLGQDRVWDRLGEHQVAIREQVGLPFFVSRCLCVYIYTFKYQ